MEINIIDTILKLSDICYSLNEDTLKNENISRPESFILLSIKPGEMITGNELAGRNSLSPSRVSRIVEHMIEKDLLVRTEVRDDRRYVNLSLSKLGIKKHTSIMKLKNECEKKIKSQLREDELKTVENGLMYLKQVMEK
jgi:DNA-binding MarR family transcriptional regulator